MCGSSGSGSKARNRGNNSSLSEDKGNRNDGSSKDCCSGTKGKSAVDKDKSEQCSDSQQKSTKELEEEEEEVEESEPMSESSDEEKAPTKQCEEEEMSEESDGEEEKMKAASAMCDCVKNAASQAKDKLKDVPKTSQSGEQAKAVPGRPGPCNPMKGKNGSADSKKAKHVPCCQVETSSSPAPEGGKNKSAKEQCESKSKREGKEKGDDEGKPLVREEKAKKRDPNLPMDCECIQKALNTCKSGGASKLPKPDAKKPDKKPTMKPNKNPDKKPNKTPEKIPEQKLDNMPNKKPNDKKPDLKKKGCTKKKPPVVKCRDSKNVYLEREMTNSSRRKYKYKCMEPLCYSSDRYDRWLDHCKRKHVYKYCNRIEIKHKVVKVKHYDTPWRRWRGDEPLHGRVLLDRRSMAPGTSSMLRARRRDVNSKPNRVLDRNSSRGMIYENEELRLRTININAEVEKGVNDIKKLRRENDQLRREIWNLRDEYDRLEMMYKAKHASEDEEEVEGEEEEEDDDEEEGEEEEEEENSEGVEEAGRRDTGARDGMTEKTEGDVLSVVEEEPEDISDNGEDRPRTVSFREERLQALQPLDPEDWPDDSFIPGPRLSVPRGIPDTLHSFFQDDQPSLNKVLTPGGSEVVTTAILQRRQSYTHAGDPTKDTITCATSQHTTTPGVNPFNSFQPSTHPQCRSPPTTSECEAYAGPAPCFMRLNSVQPFTLVFPVNEPHLANLSVQEVIDALSDQLGAALMHSLRGVRLVGGSCYLSFSAQHDADAALAATLLLRGAPLLLEDASVGATILSLTGVPHDMSDDGVANVLSHFGSLVGPVERRVYKGVDTGERLVRLRAQLAIPRWIWLDGCRVCLKVLRSEDIAHHKMTRRKSFRSHINVQLKPIVDDGTPPGPSSCGASPLSTPPPRTTLSSTNPFACGSVPSLPVAPTTVDSQFPYLNNTSVSTPNIFQESPFSFPSPYLTAEPPGLRRINSVMGTMSLGTPPEVSHTRSASSPPAASSASPKNTSNTDGERGETTGQTGIPPSPNSPRKTPLRHKPSRKISKMSMDSRKTNGETSSSDQDSPNKPGRRRPSTVIFKQKPILNRTLSSELDCTGYDATCSERERSNSDLSSRQSICKRKLSTTGRENGKVPWCGCWGNGCI